MGYIFCLMPTNFCNFNCGHCGVKKTDKIGYASVKKMVKVIEKAKKQNFQNLDITGGGEPSLEYENLLKIVNEASKRNIQCSLVTNGSFLLKDLNRLEELKENGLQLIVFSLDAFHLEFISLKFLSKIIKKSFEIKLDTHIKLSHLPGDKKPVIKILKDLKNDLDAKIYILTWKDEGKGKIKKKKNSVKFEFFPIKKTPYTKLIFKTKKNRINRIGILRCKLRMPTIDYKENILPCCCFEAINNPGIYNMGKIDDLHEGRDIDEYPPFLRKIVYNRFPFVDIWLRVR
ncbi:MAG: radical SAM protein, partial [archaeon]